MSDGTEDYSSWLADLANTMPSLPDGNFSPAPPPAAGTVDLSTPAGAASAAGPLQIVTGNQGGAANQTPVNIVCPPVNARILQGNSNFIGSDHGAFGRSVPVTAGSAAIIPSEFGMTKGQLRPYVGQISAIVNGQPLFNGVTDVIANKTPPRGAPAGLNTRQAFEYLNPGSIIVEVPGLPKDMGVKSTVFSVPPGVYCPVPPPRSH